MEKTTSNLRQMMRDRGFDDWEESAPDFLVSGNSKILIYVCPMEKFNIEGMKYMVYQLQQHKLRHGIIVYHNILTSSARKAIENLTDYTLELFEKKELQYNPTHHRLYCPHTIIPKEDVQKELRVPVSSLPILLRNDVISRYFRFLKGDVIRIVRKNGSVAYRLVK